MGKEFEEALQKFLDEYLALCEKLHTNQQEKMLLDKNSPYNVLKQALTELQAIKEAKPSEELEALRRIKIFLGYNYCSVDLPNELKCVEQALIKAQEQKKVLEIIVRKNVMIYALKECKNLEEYNDLVSTSEQLTQEEFDLLKRWTPGWKCNH